MLSIQDREVEIPRRDFVTLETLGEGQFGRVDLVVDPDGRKFALKILDKAHPKFRRRGVDNEISALYIIEHQNVCDIVDDWETEDAVFILLEFVEGLDLVTVLEDDDFAPVEEEVAANLFQQVIEGLAFCHSKGIAHRDVKLDNVMVDRNGIVKLIDFGLVKLNHAEKTRDDVGSLEYCAPEICRKSEYDAFRSDVWSAGVLLYALLHGEFPFTTSEIKSFQCGARSSVPKCQTSKQAADLLEKMLSFDPQERPTLAEVLKHPWLQSFQTSESSES